MAPTPSFVGPVLSNGISLSLSLGVCLRASGHIPSPCPPSLMHVAPLPAGPPSLSLLPPLNHRLVHTFSLRRPSVFHALATPTRSLLTLSAIRPITATSCLCPGPIVRVVLRSQTHIHTRAFRVFPTPACHVRLPFACRPHRHVVRSIRRFRRNAFSVS